jgi:hypothetical protein
MLAKQVTRLVFGILLLLASPSLTQGQASPTLSFGIGGNYLRVLGGWGIGGELNARLTFPTDVLQARPFLGVRARAAKVTSPSVFGSDGRLAGTGVHFGVEWSFLNRRIRTHVNVPLELVYAGWDNGWLICTIPTGARDCEPDHDTALAVGVGSGANVRLVEGVDLSVGVTGQWGAFDLQNSNMIWSSVFGFTFGLGSMW